jgi:carbohydrate diacid regulator
MTAASAHDLIERLAQRAHSTFATDIEVLDAEGALIATCGNEDCASEKREPAGWMQVPFSVLGQSGRLNIRQPEGEMASPRLIESVVDLLVNQIALLDCLPRQHELKHQFIHRLLHSPDEDEEALLREGQSLGMELSRPRAILLIDAGEYLEANAGPLRLQDNPDHHWLQAQSLIRKIVRFFSLPSDAICAYLGQGEIAVLKASTSRDLGPWVGQHPQPEEVPSSWSNLEALKVAATQLLQTLRTEVNGRLFLGVGRYHPGLRGLARSYQDARTALAIGHKLSRDHGIFCLDQLGLAALIGTSDEQTRFDLARHLLGPLENESELLQTLAVFFEENCSVITASNSLAIHRNTLNYRLEKVRALIGLDARHFEDVSLIRYALIICQLSDLPSLCI